MAWTMSEGLGFEPSLTPLVRKGLHVTNGAGPQAFLMMFTRRPTCLAACGVWSRITSGCACVTQCMSLDFTCASMLCCPMAMYPNGATSVDLKLKASTSNFLLVTYVQSTSVDPVSPHSSPSCTNSRKRSAWGQGHCKTGCPAAPLCSAPSKDHMSKPNVENSLWSLTLGSQRSPSISFGKQTSMGPISSDMSYNCCISLLACGHSI
mmetsp:Transcript_60146/g.140133  ORF Transcript_60146/g.140133 Transcript_60146/m.140133 type:complete len:207 (+) Transcript_60146:372-992(+)